MQAYISEVTILRALQGLRLLSAEEFCERWHGLERLSEADRNQAKVKWGYRAKCTRLLAAVLQLKEETVSAWGSTFERMPISHQVTLAYADVLRQITLTSNAQQLLKALKP